MCKHSHLKHGVKYTSWNQKKQGEMCTSTITTEYCYDWLVVETDRRSIRKS